MVKVEEDLDLKFPCIAIDYGKEFNSFTRLNIHIKTINYLWDGPSNVSLIQFD